MAEIANRSTWSDVFMYSFTAFLRDRCCAEVTCRQKFRRLNAAESFFSGGVAFVTESLRCARSLPGLCSTHAKRVPRVRPRSSLQRRHVARVSALPQTKTTAVATGYGRLCSGYSEVRTTAKCDLHCARASIAPLEAQRRRTGKFGGRCVATCKHS